MKNIILIGFLFLSLITLSQTTGTLTDARDGKIYKTVVIGTQTWMAENLNTVKFQNGDPIPEAKSDDEWLQAAENEQPAWCYFNNDKVYEGKFGRLYNWYALNDPRGLAPRGYSVPNNYDWDILINFMGGIDNMGLKLKSTKGWFNSGNGTNSVGFNGLPGGFRYSVGTYGEIGNYGFWWSSSSDNDPHSAWVFGLNTSTNSIQFSNWKAGGMSIRCIKE